MTRGTVAYIGRVTREAELLIARLKKEGFEVETARDIADHQRRRRSLRPQAVLVAYEAIGPNSMKSLDQYGCPIIAVGWDDQAPNGDVHPSVGEVWNLHAISLAEAMRRLKFAIALMYASH